MPDIMTFSTFDPPGGGSPFCSLCSAGPSAIHYRVASDDGISKPLNGYCCVRCAVNLLSALEQRQGANTPWSPLEHPNSARPAGFVAE